MEIITCTSNCEKEQHRSSKNAAATNSEESTCLKPNPSPGDSPVASCARADEIAAYISALDPLDADALVDTVQHWLSVAVAEALATYKLSSAADALAAVTKLAEVAVNNAVTAAASPRDHEPQLQHSRKEAARILGMSLRSVAAYIKAGLLKVRHEGGRVKILHSELLRFLRSDCKKPVASNKKLLHVSVKAPSSPKLKVG